MDLAGVTPLALDITDPASVAAAAQAANGVAILVNNAGLFTRTSLLTGDLATIRLEMDTIFFGTLAVTRAFTPQLAAHGSSAVLNILSALSWLSIPRSGAYCAAKSAEWSLTNALRLELAPQGTRVTALHVAYMDTDMARDLDVAKSDPAAIAKLAIDGIEAGDAEIIADETSRRVLAGLSAGVGPLPPGRLTRPASRHSLSATRTASALRCAEAAHHEQEKRTGRPHLFPARAKTRTGPPGTPPTWWPSRPGRISAELRGAEVPCSAPPGREGPCVVASPGLRCRS